MVVLFLNDEITDCAEPVSVPLRTFGRVSLLSNTEWHMQGIGTQIFGARIYEESKEKVDQRKHPEGGA
jgi:hypothetical protein